MKYKHTAFYSIIIYLVSVLWLRFFAGYIFTFQHDHEPVFLFTREYILTQLTLPGGLSELMARFIMQFYVNPWLGAGVLSLMVMLLLLFAWQLTKHHIGITLLFWVVVLAFITIPTGNIAILVALYVVIKTLAGEQKFQSPAGIWLFRFIAVPLLLWIAGSWVWFYVICVSLRHILQTRKMSGVVAGFLGASLLFALLSYRFLWVISPHVFFLGLFPFDSLIGIILILTVLLIIFYSTLPKFSHKNVTIIFSAIAGIVLIVITVINLTNPQRTTERWREYLKTEHYSDVIAEAKKTRDLNRIQTLYVNYALAKDDQLFDTMFSFPQMYGTNGLLPNPHRGITTRNIDEFWFIGEFYYEIGYFDKAYRIACDQLVFHGVTPYYTKLMIKCLLAEGHINSANKYLYLMEHTLFHRKWAQRYRAITHDQNMYLKEFASVRQFRSTKKKIISYDPSTNLLTALEQQPVNPLAFSYLCAWNLLEKNPVFLVDNVWILRELGYSTLPKHYQEALLLYQISHPNETISLEGIKSNRDVVMKFIDFGNKFSQDKKPVYSIYKSMFDGSYLLYWFFTVNLEETS